MPTESLATRPWASREVGSRLDKDVVVRLKGGLGNQLFQYAAGRSLAERLQADLKVDVAAFGSGDRRYGLGHFIASPQVATPEEVRSAGGARRIQLVLGMLHARGPVLRERHFHFDRRFEQIATSVYLDGYWQSERYFAHIAPLVRDELRVRVAPSIANAATLERIRAGTSVAVHVRRGDYVTNAKARRTHGGCPPDYYTAACRFVVERTRRPSFFVFSDDPEWVRANLSFPGAVEYVDHNGPRDAHEDLRLMAACQHHVIANSTFSWWGAWLGHSKTQIVVAPQRWFATRTRRTADLFPTQWVLL